MEHDKDGEPIAEILRIKQKESEFVRNTLGKDEGYSTRSEVTGKDGADLPTPIINVNRTDAILGNNSISQGK